MAVETAAAGAGDARLAPLELLQVLIGSLTREALILTFDGGLCTSRVRRIRLAALPPARARAGAGVDRRLKQLPRSTATSS
jgi:hypothetical protein